MKFATKVTKRSCVLRTQTQKIKDFRRSPLFFGAGNVTRTRDLLITNELLYQLSYSSNYYTQVVLYIIVWSFSRGKI